MVLPDNKEWIKKTLLHKETDEVPYNFMFSPKARIIVQKYYGTKHVENDLGFPISMGSPKRIKPLYASPKDYGDTIKDEFGVIWTTSDIDRGAPIGAPLKDANLSGYNFPKASDATRFKDLGNWLKRNDKNYTVIWVGDLWERATFMRGMENILLDLELNSVFVEALLSNLTDYILETMEILFKEFAFDAVALSDDYGTQKAMLISPPCWRKFIKPNLKKIYNLAKHNNRGVFHHSCGNIYPVIGDLIDIGLDILNPIQPEAMDIFGLKREFGENITFCGGIRTQDLLIKGTPEDVKAEVRKLKEIMGKGGGYILEPGITIQADVPADNLIAMIEEAKKTN